MTSPTLLSLRLLTVGALAGLASAQVTTIPNPTFTNTSGFGAEGLIVDDKDGGGRPDYVIGSVNQGAFSGEAHMISSETGAVLGVAFFPVSSDFGRAMADVGDLDLIAGDEYVIASPSLGLLCVCTRTLSQGLGDVLSFVQLPPGFGDTLATLPDLTGDNKAELAVGSLTTNQVLIVNIAAALGSSNPPATVLFTITDPRNGGFGSTLASTGNRLVVGAPNWSNTVPPTVALGYVDVFQVTQGGATMTATFAAPGPVNVAQNFGSSLAAIGDLTGDGLSEYAIQAPTGASSVYVFSEAAPAGPMSTLGYAATGPGGRIAGLGDIDGDGRGDFAMSDGNTLFIIGSPTNATLAQITLGATTSNSGCVVTARDAVQGGISDLLTGQPTVGLGQVRKEPLAVLRSLPNPSDLAIQVPATRPTLGANYPFTVTTTQTSPVYTILFADFAQPGNTPIGNGISYLTPTAFEAATFGVVTGTPVNVAATVPPAIAFLYAPAVVQAGGATSAGQIIVSNALHLRLGTF